MTRRREIWAFYLVLFENKLGGRLLEGERLLETIRYMLMSHVRLYPRIIVSNSHGNTSKYVYGYSNYFSKT